MKEPAGIRRERRTPARGAPAGRGEAHCRDAPTDGEVTRNVHQHSASAAPTRSRSSGEQIKLTRLTDDDDIESYLTTSSASRRLTRLVQNDSLYSWPRS